MKMTNSGREIILQAITSLLGDIERGSGYNTDPQFVTRGPVLAIGEVDATKLPGFWLEDGFEACANLCSAGAEAVFDVWIHAQIYDASDTSAGINALLWDVKRALKLHLALNPVLWENGEGQVINASLPEIYIFRQPTQPGFFGLSLRVRVEYREPLELTADPE